MSVYRASPIRRSAEVLRRDRASLWTTESNDDGPVRMFTLGGGVAEMTSTDADVDPHRRRRACRERCTS